MQDKPIPYDIVAEKAVLGGLLLYPDIVQDVAPWLRAEHFYMQKHVWIYDAILDCWRRRVPPDLSTVSDVLRRQDTLADIGGIAYLGELSAEAPPSAHIDHCARIVQRTATHRAIIQTGGMISALGYDERQDLSELLSVINDKIKILNDQQQHPQGISAAELVHMHLPPVRWFIPGLLSQGFGYIAAKPGVGKTWLLLQWAVALAAGGYVFGDIQVQQTPVLFLALEDSKASIQERIKFVCKEMQPPQNLIIYTEEDGWKPLDEGGLNQLEAAIRAIQPGVVIIDTLTALAPSPPRGANPYSGEYKSYIPIRALAEAYKVCIVGTWHFNKAGKVDVREMVSGTMGLPAVSVNRIGIVRDEDSAEGRLKSHSKRGATADWTLSFDQVTCQWVKLGDTQQVKLSASRQAILDYLGEAGNSPVRDLLDVTGMSYNTLVQNLKRMRDDGLIVSPGKGYYALPDSVMTKGHDSHDSVMTKGHDSHDSVMTNGVMTFYGNGTAQTDRHDIMTQDTHESDTQKPCHDCHDCHDGGSAASGSYDGHDTVCHDAVMTVMTNKERISTAGYDIFEVAGRWHIALHNIKLHTCRTRTEAERFALGHMGGR